MNLGIVPKIGLEIHVSPRTASKLFCGCSTGEGKANSHTCEVCLGFPGSKPVLNRMALEHAIQVALALHCQIQRRFSFSRKTYFYPDLAKNFQITQYEIPLGVQGALETVSGARIRIRRVHLEEDPAALVHEGGIGAGSTCSIDYNRSGHPLVEIVTEPDLASAKDARLFLDELSAILSYLPFFCLGTDALKADANVSINGGARVEIKNITGFRDVERAIEGEICRQARQVESGEKIEQHTRGFEAETGKTFLLRTKEGEDDYGYIFEPDIPPVELDEAWLQKLNDAMPRLPAMVRAQLAQAGYSEYDARVIASKKILADLIASLGSKPAVGELLSRNLIAISNYENRPLEQVLEGLDFHRSALNQLCDWMGGERITEKTFKEALIAAFGEKKGDPLGFIEKNHLLLDGQNDQTPKWVEKAFCAHPTAVSDAKTNNEKSVNFLVGKAMRESKGRGDPRRVAEEVRKRLGRP